jgi:NitT/TauT family transport system substrate-binding protein
MAIDDIFDKINKGKVSRRTVLKAGVAAGIGLAGASIAGCTSPGVTPTTAPQKVKETVNVGYLITDHDAPLFIAKTKGYLNNYGVNVKLTNFNSGPEILTQIAGGTIDIGIAGVPPVILAYDKDPTMKIVGAVHTNGSGLFVKKGSGISKFADLKGKKVATPGPGSIQDILVRDLCKTNNLAYGTDVIATKMPQGQWIGAVDAGTVAAVMAWEPFVTMAEMQGVGETILRSEDIRPGHPCDTVVTSTKMISDYPDSVLGFLKAHKEAVDLIKTNPQEAAQIVAQKEWMNDEVPVERAAMEHMVFLYKPDEAYIAGAEQFAKDLKDLELVKQVYTRDQLFDLSLVNRI